MRRCAVLVSSVGGRCLRTSVLIVASLAAVSSCDWPDPPDEVAPPPPVTWAANAETGFVGPVDGEIRDPFRAPDHAYGPGNRGIEYRTESGSPVRAVEDGTVSFAGPVAGRLVVAIDHAAGRRSTYTGLDRLAVVRGDPVDGGHTIGAAGPVLHFGVKVDGRYVDPASLFGPPVVVLLPTE